MTTDVVTATMQEALAEPMRESTLRRLHDWQQRVHALYHDVQSNLGPGYTYDRTGKNRSLERRVQQAGLIEHDVPPVDILRIERDGQAVAQFLPRTLWIIGSNGQVDLVITSQRGARRYYMLFDESVPFTNRSDWRLVRPTDILSQPPFHPERFHELLE